MRVDLFDFDLPPENIALRPARPRDAARMLRVGREGLTDHIVRDLPSLLRAGDVLVFNDTRVIPAQLEGQRGEARIGATLHKRLDLRRWQAFVRNGKRLREGDTIYFGAGVSGTAEARHADGSWTLFFPGEEPVEVLLERAGRMPLPPYIAGKRETDAQDRSDYQTMFAQKDGAVAAPTAALHFTPDPRHRTDQAAQPDQQPCQRPHLRDRRTSALAAGPVHGAGRDDRRLGGQPLRHAPWRQADPAAAHRGQSRADGAAGMAVVYELTAPTNHGSSSDESP